jgi:hypothetical protein
MKERKIWRDRNMQKERGDGRGGNKTQTGTN